MDVGRIVGGQALAFAITLAGVLGAVGSFGALMMSFTRLPVVMAEDGYLAENFRPQARSHRRTVGCRDRLRAILGAVLPARIRAEPHPRCVAHRAEYSAGVLGAGRAADPRAESCAAVPRAGRHCSGRF